MKLRSIILLALSVVLLMNVDRTFGVDSLAEPRDPISNHFVTNVAQFRTLSGADYMTGCDFKLHGVVTLVDTNRDLTVLQDASGAVALNFHVAGRELQVGQLVTLEGSNCCPYFAPFPAYPYHPSGSNIRSSLEAPMNWGEYHLTRMRGYVHPPATGEYSFWIASDNSSELWLSPDAQPSKAKKIASVARFQWTLPHEWSKFPSQRSEPVWLKADETYYIEALGEQTTVGENLAVAWQGPSLPQSIIASTYLTPWGATNDAAHGILREYWTNYFAGDLTGLGGPREFDSALSVQTVHVSVEGQRALPMPARISLDRPWQAENNFRWVEVEGKVQFMGANNAGAVLEISDGHAHAQVRVSHWNESLAGQIRDAPVRIQGVCEGASDERGVLAPGIIWTSGTNSVVVIEAAKTNANTETTRPPASSAEAQTFPAMQGFYSTRGVVTFNDRAFGKDYLFVQEDSLAVLVSPEGTLTNNQLKVGHWVDLGGALQTDKSIPTLTPLAMTDLGWHSLPTPILQPLEALATGEGRWSELAGVVHAANTNGTLSILSPEGPAYLWIGQISARDLRHYVDAKLRARGVLLLTALDAPTLLVPSRSYVDVEEEAPRDPFTTPKRAITEVNPDAMQSSWFHRTRVAGEVTYRDTESFFIQDASGGMRVHSPPPPTVRVGDAVEVVAFPSITDGGVRVLTDAQLRPANDITPIHPATLDIGEAMAAQQVGTLVHLTAVLLDRKTNATAEVLELQERQRIFVATLSGNSGILPNIAVGSRLQITGVCENGTGTESLTDKRPMRTQFLAPLNLLLRSPADVIVLNGPPWWTWQRTVTLVGALLTVLTVALLWVQLLQRRLDRQRIAQQVFSRQVLEQLEEERRRIAVNLHDSLGQILLAIKNQALLAIQRPPDQQGMRHRLDEISSASSLALEEVRQITHGLRPYQLDRLGLTQAIRASVNRATGDSPILFATRVDDIDGLLDKDAEIHIYRIVQEAVTNIVKHSAATEGAVVIKKRASAILVSIRDNGRGFNPAKPSPQPYNLGYGLTGITERVRFLGGTLAIDSRPGEGTSLTVEIPLPIQKR